MTREEAIKHLSEWMDEKMWMCFGTIDREAIGMAIEALRDKPKGKWILECDGGNECDNLYKCSVCGNECGCEEYDKPNFCPNCGVDMRIGVEQQ